MMSIGVGGAWATLTPYVGVGGAWKQVTGAWVGVNGVWQSLTTPPMTASASPTTSTGSVNSSSGTRANVLTGSTTVTVSGGTGPFTHSWAIAFSPGLSTDTSGTASVSSASSATTTFLGQTCNGPNAPGQDFYIATDTITDTYNGAQVQVTVTVSCKNTHVGP